MNLNMAKTIKITFRQIREDQETAERHINEAFDILFAEVLKRLQEKKLNNSLSNHSFAGEVIIHG